MTNGVDCFGSLLGWHDGDNFKVNEILPARDPFLEKARVVAFHQLEAADQICLHPAVNIPQAIREHSASLPAAAVHCLSVSVPEPLDNHEKHAISP